jgi:hypothetical protein
VGKGGSGKSTVALACLEAGFQYAGDDYVLLSDEGAPYVHSLYGSAKLHRDHARRFPELFSAATLASPEAGDQEAKAVAIVSRTHPGRVVAGFPLAAVLVPRIVGSGETVAARVSAAEALLALAPSSILQLPGAGHTAFQRLASAMRRVPAYRLSLGADIGGIARAIEPLLRGRAIARGS